MRSCKICVLGGGSFGTAMAQEASYNNMVKSVSIYARDDEVVSSINSFNINPKVFSNYKLSQKITATKDLANAINESDIIISCIPAQQIRQFLRQNKSIINPQIPFVSCSKGIVLETGQLISQVVKQELGDQSNYVALSGPSFAQEMMNKFPTMVVVASETHDVAKLVQQTLSSINFKIYTQNDVVGVELAGALKNVLAIGAGFIQGSGYGYNTTTAFISRGVREMQLFAQHYGAHKSTFYGLAGIGDIMLTCFGSISRNRQFGFRLGQGESLQQIIQSSKGVVEGIPTLEIVRQKSLEFKLDMPLTFTIYDAVNQLHPKEEIFTKILQRSVDHEFAPSFEHL